MRKEVFKFLVLFAVALGAGPASGMMWQWSQTASTNATADPSINWSEGMSPSSVNDSARAMMSVTAKWRDDISGALVTTGTSAAYAVTTNAGNLAATPITGQMIALRPNATNAAATTLAADGGTAWPIQTSAGVAIGAGTMISGSPYSLMFNGTAWLLRDFYGDPYQIPLGGYLYSSNPNVPNANFVVADGTCISRTTYAAYFAAVSTTYGACDGLTTFGTPNHMGRVPAVNDTGGNFASICGAFTGGSTCGNTASTIAQSNLPSVSLSAASLTATTTMLNGLNYPNTTESAGTGGVGIPRSVGSGALSASTSIGGSVPLGGSNTAFSNLPPMFGVYVYVRIF